MQNETLFQPILALIFLQHEEWLKPSCGVQSSFSAFFYLSNHPFNAFMKLQRLKGIARFKIVDSYLRRKFGLFYAIKNAWQLNMTYNNYLLTGNKVQLYFTEMISRFFIWTIWNVTEKALKSLNTAMNMQFCYLRLHKYIPSMIYSEVRFE